MEEVIPCSQCYGSLSGSQQETDGLHPSWVIEESLINGLFPKMYPEYMEAKKEKSVLQIISQEVWLPWDPKGQGEN